MAEDMSAHQHNLPKILLVDNMSEKRLSLEAVLEGPHQKVVSVSSGEEALRRLLVDDFAVILLDVHLPGLDGFETASLIRQRKRSEHTPIIFLTAFPDDAYAKRGYSLGAVDYILAPVVPDVLRTKVSVFVELYQKTEQIKRQAEERVLLAQEHAARLRAPLLVGAFGRSEGSPARPYNALYLVDETGVAGRYAKRRLVPVIERNPLASSRVLALLGDTTSYEVGPAASPLEVADASLGTLICFESAFAKLAREQRRGGAELLINATNDAWFEDSSAPHQHLQIARMRAIEMGRSLLRVANTGISGVIGPDGVMTQASPQFEIDVLRATIKPRTGLTPYARLGDAPLWVLALAGLAAVFLAGRRRA